MSRALLKIVVFAGCISLVSLAATAQEVVHAMTGIVNNIDSAAKTITVFADDGSVGTFHDMAGSVNSIAFDKNLRTDATAADEFKKQGARVIVFYYGIGDGRTVVALKSLGEGPFSKNSGTVVKFDKKDHSLSIKDSSGAIELFKITTGTVADTDAGAAEGLKFDPHKGEPVRVIATQNDGSLTALFINGALAL
jgi:hypothetical protein